MGGREGRRGEGGVSGASGEEDGRARGGGGSRDLFFERGEEEGFAIGSRPREGGTAEGAGGGRTVRGGDSRARGRGDAPAGRARDGAARGERRGARVRDAARRGRGSAGVRGGHHRREETRALFSLVEGRSGGRRRPKRRGPGRSRTRRPRAKTERSVASDGPPGARESAPRGPGGPAVAIDAHALGTAANANAGEARFLKIRRGGPKRSNWRQLACPIPRSQKVVTPFAVQFRETLTVAARTSRFFTPSRHPPAGSERSSFHSRLPSRLPLFCRRIPDSRVLHPPVGVVIPTPSRRSSSSS